jgi:predicted SAM-dependent methyltransferase
MKYLNLGCGNNYSTSKEWININFKSQDKNVIEHNLLSGIPFENETFDLVYHSHVLEHFNKKDGEKFISECNRVLRQNGIIRIAIPDLEKIIREYLVHLEKGLKHPEDQYVRSNYNWILIELFDQMIRNKSGGEMKSILEKKELINEDFIYYRNGNEVKEIREAFKSRTKKPESPIRKLNYIRNSLSKIKFIIKFIINSNNINYYLERFPEYKIGKFRKSGEIHQWMYDRYSLFELLKKHGFYKMKVVSSEESKLKNWSNYNLDSINGETRKPDSLFVEALKK